MTRYEVEYQDAKTGQWSRMQCDTLNHASRMMFFHYAEMVADGRLSLAQVTDTQGNVLYKVTR